MRIFGNLRHRLVDFRFANRSFSTWRTLHESEPSWRFSINSKAGRRRYLTHLQYGLAFHRLIEDVTRSDQIFAKLKMK
jgi:hypothetical protein